MKLPNGDKAVVDLKKLRDYCLSPVHRRGKHKARLFEAAAGITANNVNELFAALCDAAKQQEATATRDNGFGQLYELLFEFEYAQRTAKILSVWIVLKSDQIPRLVTCYPL